MSSPEHLAVAAAYRSVLANSGSDQRAYAAALDVYRNSYPDVPDDEARVNVAKLIAEAADTMAGFWEGVGGCVNGGAKLVHPGGAKLVHLM
jgi:hypothetical protein